MSEAEKVIFVMNVLKKTEELDIDFLLDGLAQSGSMAYKRNFIRSFRSQIIQVALGTAMPLRS